MIRALLCITIILASMLPAVPFSSLSEAAPSHSSVLAAPNAALPYLSDPNGTIAAFNTTVAQFNLYTEASAVTSSATGGGTLSWIASMTNTANGAPISGTGFTFVVPSGTNVSQTVTWNLTVPKGVGSSTYVRFDWNGTSGLGTSASYSLFNGTGTTKTIFLRVTKQNATFSVTTPHDATGGTPLACGEGHECVDVSSFRGFNMTLTFMFNSTLTGGGLNVRTANIEVASVEAFVSNSLSHSMQLNPTNSTEVYHTGRLSVNYNSTVQFHNAANRTTWGQTLVSLFVPKSYRLDNVTFNSALLFPSPPPTVLFDQGNCSAGPCTNVNFLSFNMTSPVAANAQIIVHTRSLNAINSLTPTVLGVDTTYFVPSDLMSIRLSTSPGVNITARQEITFVDPTGLVFPGPNPASNKGGTYFINATVPFQASPGSWIVNGTYLGGYDLGVGQHSFIIRKIVPKSPFQATGEIGSGGVLRVTGSLDYDANPGQPAQNVNTTVVAVDKGAPPGPVTKTGQTSTGLYISNVTLANGVFTAGQTLTMYFTIVNPTSQPTQPFNASVTIDHEWYVSQTHGVKATFNLSAGDKFGDQGFTDPTTVVYRADISITGQGIHLQIKSVTSPASPGVTLTMSQGTSTVTSGRQHSGLFKITLTSNNLALPLGDPNRTKSTQAESPTYAFTLDTDLIPSRLLDSSPAVPTASDGSFSATIASDSLLGAKNLVLFALGRDANGIVLIGSDPQKVQKTSFFSDSTLLLPSTQIPSDVGTKQSVTVTLSLKSNSSNLPINLTVNLLLSGTVVSSQTATIAQGSTQTLSFTFQAPSTAGAYLLTFMSPNYLSGTPILTKSLQVSVVSGPLQLLIPALIGLVVAILVLGYYAIRRNPQAEPDEDKPRQSGKPQKPQPGQQPSKSLTRT